MVERGQQPGNQAESEDPNIKVDDVPGASPYPLTDDLLLLRQHRTPSGEELLSAGVDHRASAAVSVLRRHEDRVLWMELGGWVAGAVCAGILLAQLNREWQTIPFGAAQAFFVFIAPLALVATAEVGADYGEEQRAKLAVRNLPGPGDWDRMKRKELKAQLVSDANLPITLRILGAQLVSVALWLALLGLAIALLVTHGWVSVLATFVASTVCFLAGYLASKALVRLREPPDPRDRIIGLLVSTSAAALPVDTEIHWRRGSFDWRATSWGRALFARRVLSVGRQVRRLFLRLAPSSGPLRRGMRSRGSALDEYFASIAEDVLLGGEPRDSRAVLQLLEALTAACKNDWDVLASATPSAAAPRGPASWLPRAAFAAILFGAAAAAFLWAPTLVAAQPALVPTLLGAGLVAASNPKEALTRVSDAVTDMTFSRKAGSKS